VARNTERVTTPAVIDPSGPDAGAEPGVGDHRRGDRRHRQQVPQREPLTVRVDLTGQQVGDEADDDAGEGAEHDDQGVHGSGRGRERGTDPRGGLAEDDGVDGVDGDVAHDEGHRAEGEEPAREGAEGDRDQPPLRHGRGY
jgi:hypothetical protein